MITFVLLAALAWALTSIITSLLAPNVGREIESETQADTDR
jgi:hypothetical protein